MNAKLYLIGKTALCIEKPKMQIPGVTFPKLGQLYVIRDVIRHGDKIGYLLQEILNKPTMHEGSMIEISFSNRLFAVFPKTVMKEAEAEIRNLVTPFGIEVSGPDRNEVIE